MNRINPKVLLDSKWTRISAGTLNKEKHFVVTYMSFDENQRVTKCTLEAVINGHEYEIDWRELKDSHVWKMGWK